MKYKIILASQSKRRSRILKECGIPHKVAISRVPEKRDRTKGAKFNVLYNARAKAERIAQRYNKGFVIGCDTVVLSGKHLVGKPRSVKEARRLLRAFSGKTIFVYTGLCVIDAKEGRSRSGFDVSKVRVRRLSGKKIAEFVKATGPHDKAGGFSIEGAGAFIFDDIEGSFYNVLGLPMMKLDELFGKLGINLLSPQSYSMNSPNKKSRFKKVGFRDGSRRNPRPVPSCVKIEDSPSVIFKQEGSE